MFSFCVHVYVYMYEGICLCRHVHTSRSGSTSVLMNYLPCFLRKDLSLVLGVLARQFRETGWQAPGSHLSLLPVLRCWVYVSTFSILCGSWKLNTDPQAQITKTLLTEWSLHPHPQIFCCSGAGHYFLSRKDPHVLWISFLITRRKIQIAWLSFIWWNNRNEKENFHLWWKTVCLPIL